MTDYADDLELIRNAVRAAGELAGDKMEDAPDRIVPAGMLARVVTGAIVGMALAPREQRPLAALWDRQSPRIFEGNGFDPNRDKGDGARQRNAAAWRLVYTVIGEPSSIHTLA